MLQLSKNQNCFSFPKTKTAFLGQMCRDLLQSEALSLNLDTLYFVREIFCQLIQVNQK